jgi:hypothetical protein
LIRRVVLLQGMLLGIGEVFTIDIELNLLSV